MPSKKVTIKKNPKLDWAVALWGGKPVPTKQDKFKPLIGYQGVLEENGIETTLDDLYIKNPDKKSVEEFELKLREFLKANLAPHHPHKFPSKVEVILCFDINQKRLFEVDVDNLSKTVLDCMSGLVFDDDSQVVNLLAMKGTHPFNTNGLSIAVNSIENSWFDKIKLFYMDEKIEE